ncbi:hypothetical protein GYB22_00860 [bacterium]|nr:hypothetical protein [bacterium]
MIQKLKHKLLLLFALAFSQTAFAEYQAFHFKFKVTTAEQEYIGYGSKAYAYIEFDSLDNTRHLKYALSQRIEQWDQRDSMFFYLDRFAYSFINIYDSSRIDTEYYYFNPTGLLLDEIQNIEILDQIQYSYMRGIGSEHEIKDTSWMKRSPVQRFLSNGYLCTHAIYIHEASEVTKNVIDQLSKFAEELEQLEKEESEREEYEREDERFRSDDWIDEKIHDILEELKGEKVVIVSECSC